MLLTDPSPPALAPQLSFVAALALHDAVAECAPQVGPLLKVKWPNDLLLGGAKLAGILIEGESDPVFAVVDRPRRQLRRASARYAVSGDRSGEAGALASRRRSCLHALAQAMQRRLAQWARGEGFAAIRADWLKRAAGLGNDIRVRLPEREFSGRFEGLDDAGHLLVRGPAGVTTVTAGEVFDLGRE